MEIKKEENPNPAIKYFIFALIGLGIIFLIVQLFSLTGSATSATTSTTGNSNSISINSGGKNLQINVDAISAEVVPKEGFTIEATWGDTISKMVKAGVLDEGKLNSILSSRYGQSLTAEQKKLLESENSNENLTINLNNGVFMMYILWVIGKDNDNPIQKNSPFAKYFNNYDIGVGKAGYADTQLLSLTPEQQKIAENVALNSYRPCCGNPSGWPDCSHGFAALGLIELMASQGYSENEIFNAFVKFNSVWYPSTYVKNAIYFNITENKTWSEVDRKEVAGKQFSSASGTYAVDQYLKNLGIN